MIDAGCVRTSINHMTARIRGLFRWAVAEELVPPETLVAIQLLAGLRFGRSDAKEAEPVKPVPQAFIDAVQPHVSRQVWAMIQLQRLTGARPGEIVAMRGCDLNTKGTIWEYVPESHKTQHNGKRRIIFLGPQAQEALKPFLRMDLAAHLFSPAESREAHLEQRRAPRQTPLTPSQLARSRKPNPAKAPGEFYTVVSYGRAIRNACQRADREAHKESPDVSGDVVLIPHWHPHQLRHNAATEVRRQFGIETVRAVLGHSSIATSELYAEFDDCKAREAIALIGYLVEDVLARSQPFIIAAAKKMLKTNSSIALTLALASGGKWMNRFYVPHAVRVALMSGESGDAVIQETARRIARSMPWMNLRDYANAIWSFDLPRLGQPQTKRDLTKFIDDHALDVLIVDPA